MNWRKWGPASVSLSIAAVVFVGVSSGAAAAACHATLESFRIRSTFTALKAKLQRREPVRILAIGSSSTEGAGASSPRKTYPSQLQAKLSASWRVDTVVTNAGRSGEVAAATVNRLQKLLAGDKPDLVIWQVGTNDALRGEREDALRAAVAKGVNASLTAGVEMILMDPQYLPSLSERNRYERYVRIVDDVGSERQVSVLSRYALMRGWAQSSPEELAASLSADGLHLSDRGYDCLAGVLAERLDGAMRRLPGIASAGASSQERAGTATIE
jgi:acyl-CoA thioesterase-1